MTSEATRAVERFLRAAGRVEGAAVVLGASVNGLSFVRSLGRRGVPTLLLDGEPRVGCRTRYGEVAVLGRTPEDDPDAWRALLERIGAALARPAALLPTADDHCLFVARHRHALAETLRPIVPPLPVIEGIVDKRRQYEAARHAGVPIPRTLFPKDPDEAARSAREVPYPCILKPAVAHRGRRTTGRKVVVVGSEAELLREFRRLHDAGVALMVQEIVPGPDDALLGYLAFWDEDSREVAWLTKRKLRQNPPHFGDGSLQVTVECPQVATWSRRLLGAFRYQGFAGVEFKRDARDGTLRLMEINPRTVSGNQLAIQAGVDFPWIGWQHVVRGRVAADALRPFTPGVKYVNEEWDLKALLALRREGSLGVGTWLRSLRGARARALWAWDDPGPFAEAGWRIAGASFRRVVARAAAGPARSASRA